MNSPLMNVKVAAHDHVNTPVYLGDMGDLDDPKPNVKKERREAREREMERRRKEEKRRRIIAEKSRRANRGK